MVAFGDGISCGVAVIFGKRAVADNENLDELKQAATGPERITLIAVDLVESVFDAYSTTLQLNINQRQTVDENSDIIAVLESTPFRHILIDNL